MLLVTMCKKAHFKIVHGSLAILWSLSTCKVTKIHPLWKLVSCISFFSECILEKLSSNIISAMLPVITCKRPHSRIPHRFLTVLKCLSACQLRKTMKYEISDNILQTWSPKFAWLFQVIWYFAMKSFLKHYLEHCWNKKYTRIQYHALLAIRNASFWKNTKFALLPMGFQQFYEFQNTTYPWTFQDIAETVWHFWMGFFGTCFKFLW